MIMQSQMRTQRLTILVSEEEKRLMTEKARGLGMSVGEMLRFAYRSFGGASFDDVFLEGLAEKVEESMAEAEANIDRALASAERTLAELRATHDLAKAA